MVIFDNELDIKDKILASMATGVLARVNIVDAGKSEAEIFQDVISNEGSIEDKEFVRTVAEVSKKHPDLLYGSAILVSTVMNKNDDIFLPEETWKARKTPVNTPYNDQHKEKAIIGHIIGAEVIDGDGKVVAVQDPPEYFDISVDFVMYKSIFATLAAEIVEKAPKGEKFVSMEAIMDNFDYGVLTKAGQMQVVRRNEQTSFLSKYLRAFGGPGVYNDLRIGRVLRDFRFVGMGNVDNPANSNSKYTKIEAVSKNDVYDSIDNTFIANTVIVTAKGKVMKLENMEQALAYVEELGKQIEAAATSAKASSDEIVSLKEQIAGLTGQKDVSEASLKTANEALAAANTALEAANKELETTKADLAEKNKVLDEIRAAEKLAARVKAASEINIAVDEAKQQQIAKMTDAEFESYMLGAKETKAATEKPVEKTTTEEVAKASAEAEKTIADAEKEKGETAVEDVAAATAGQDVTAAEDKIKATASVLANVIRSTRTRTVKLTNKKNAAK